MRDQRQIIKCYENMQNEPYYLLFASTASTQNNMITYKYLSGFSAIETTTLTKAHIYIHF